MRKIRLSKSCLGEEEKAAVVKVLEKEFLGMGEEVGLFERELSEFITVATENVACVNTGTSALHLALHAVGIQPGDEVVVPSITYVASLQAITAAGGKPVICDVVEETGLIDINDAERRLTSKTKAIMPVHYASNCYGMDKIYIMAKKHNIRVVEDAAHSIGSFRNGMPIGKEGDIICFSFDGIKNITSGEGGAVVSADLEIIRKIKDARLLGVMKDTEKRLSGERSWQFDVEEQGYRYHMSNIMAAIGREQLKKIQILGKKRRAIVEFYRAELSKYSFISLMDFPINDVIPHIFVVRIMNDLRDDLMVYLKENGIDSGIHYQPNHMLSFFKTNYSLPRAEKLFKELITLPLHPDLVDEDIKYICETIASFAGKNNA